MSNRYRSILFLGAPGSGKGTQSRAIGQLPGFYWFGTGDVLRKLDPAGELGSRIHPILQRGDLVPEDLVLEVWKRHLRQACEQGELSQQNDIVLLDALPRNVSQAELMEPHVEMQLVVYLQVADDEILKERIRRRSARPDDRDEETIRHRFAVYHERTAPLLEYYGPSRIAAVDAAASPLKVVEQVAGVIRKRTNQA